MEEIIKEEKRLSRTQLQERIMTCLYQILFYTEMGEKADLKEIIEVNMGMPLKECDPFARKVIVEATRNYQSITEVIALNLVEWKFERLPLIERAILLLAYTEVLFCKIPKTVAIDVAVKLTKKFSDEESYKYINGVLDRITNG